MAEAFSACYNPDADRGILEPQESADMAALLAAFESLVEGGPQASSVSSPSRSVEASSLPRGPDLLQRASQKPAGPTPSACHHLFPCCHSPSACLDEHLLAVPAGYPGLPTACAPLHLALLSHTGALLH